MAKKVLVYWDITEQQLAKIKEIASAKGYEVEFTLDIAEASKLAEDAEIMFGGNAAPLKHAPELKWFCTHAAGVNNYLVPGIFANEEALLSNSAGAYGVTISEHIIMTSLMLMRNYNAYAQVCATQNWTHDTPMKSLNGSRITLLGTGDIGTTFAKRVKGFEPASITGVNRKGQKPDAVYDRIVKQDELADVLPETDLLVMSLPGTAQTVDLMSADRIDLLPQGAFIVNVGRGNSIDEAALVEALNSGKLAGAALDVMKTEPLAADDPLRSAKNIILTPHTAGHMTLGYTKQRAVDMFCEDLESYLSGTEMKHLVDKKAGY